MNTNLTTHEGCCGLSAADPADIANMPQNATREAGPLLGPGIEILSEMMGWQECELIHSLVQHPLLSMPSIARLACELPAAAIERHDASQPLLVPGGARDVSGSPAETLRTMDANRLWMVLWNIERVPRYGALLDAILDEVEPHIPSFERGMCRREAFLFVSSPHSVTPVHFDPEHNLLLQIRGTKEISVGRFSSREAALKELDRYHDGGHRNLTEVPPLSGTYCLRPGRGIYVYPWAPHWVLNGPQTSVSLSVTFRTRRSRREECAHRFNSRLRRHGWSSRAAGESATLDTLKAACLDIAARIHRIGGRPPGAHG